MARPLWFALAVIGSGGALVHTALAQGSGTAASASRSAPKTVDARAWPRTYQVDGVEFSLYQPQIDSWTGNVLRGRQVMAVKTGEAKGADGQPAVEQSYGVLWLSARTETDKDAREVVLSDITVERASFPNAADRQAAYLAAARKAIPATEQVASLDAIEAGLAITDATTDSADVAVDNAPPEIIVALEPAVLVLIDGDPVWRPSGVSGVDHVLNSRAPILRYQNRFYLGHEGKWASSASLTAEWASAASVPAPVTQAQARLASEQKTGPQQSAAASAKFPAIYVRTHPAELISIDGQPNFDDIDGTSLSYVINTPSDVFLDGGNQWYVLISGRWFTAQSTKGPWTYVAPSRLPADFAKIPSDGPKGAVLASIAGTPEARESLVANSVPQTATVNRREAHFTAQYDGQPQFEPIRGTSLSVAKNSAAPVIMIGTGSYLALDKGVWFTSGSANGPWTVATSVPTAVYTIPSSSPYHYVTYVRVYGSTPEVVYVGYTPGYYGTVASSGVVVYGTGYACSPWIGAYYYGCPGTYGYGAAFAFGAAVGWGLAFGWGWYDPWYYPYWGPWGYPGYWGGAGYAWGNVYGHWGSSVIAGTGAAWANAWTGNYGRGFRGGYYNPATGGRGYGYAGHNTNIYTGNTTAAAGGIRYNPETGRVVAGRGGAAGNIYTGDGIAAGTRTAVNTNTGRVTRTGGAATRSAAGATAAGGFNTAGQGGDARGGGYVHYDRATGDISKGGVVDVNGNVYAGKDGHVYRHDENGWHSMVGGQGSTRQQPAGPPDSSLDRERAARDRGFERDQMAGRGFQRPGAERPAFDRGSFGGGNFRGRMGGFRGGGRFRR